MHDAGAAADSSTSDSSPSAGSPAGIRILAVPLGETATNAYVVAVPEAPSQPCWIVDPGVEPATLVAAVRREGWTPTAIVLTHAHYDHIGGVDEIERAFGRLPILLHREEAAWCGDPLLNLSAFGPRRITCRSADRMLEEGDRLELGPSRWRVLHTPGHSPGSVCLVDDRDEVALVGDLVFAGSIGRTDFPTSDPGAMRRSLARILQELPDAITLLPGHGGATTLGEERRANPFLAPGAAW